MVFEEDMEFFEHGIIPGRDASSVLGSGRSTAQIPEGAGSLFCSDLVKMATAAHRIQKGDFIWFGFQPHGHEAQKKATTWPRLGFGSQGIMLTQKAAKSIGIFLESGWKRAGHIDMLLKEWCCDSERFQGGGSCFVWPPVGSYRAHVSDCCPDQFGPQVDRPSCWHQDWACPGTRPMHDVHGRSKKLMLPVKKGHQQVLAELTDQDFRLTGLCWRTWIDPNVELWPEEAASQRQKRELRKIMREIHTRRCMVSVRDQAGKKQTSYSFQ